MRVPSVGRPFVDLFSDARPGPSGSGGFSGAYVEQIRRTVRRTPEVTSCGVMPILGNEMRKERAGVHEDPSHAFVAQISAR